MYPLQVRKKDHLFRIPVTIILTTIIRWKVHLHSQKIKELIAILLIIKGKDPWLKIHNHINYCSNSSNNNNNLYFVRVVHLFHQNQLSQVQLIQMVIRLLRIIYLNNQIKMNLLRNHQLLWHLRNRLFQRKGHNQCRSLQLQEIHL